MSCVTSQCLKQFGWSACVQNFSFELIVFATSDIQEKQNLISVLVLIGKMNYHHSLKQLQKQLG